MSESRYFDGDFTARFQHGPLIVSREPETRALLYKRTVRQAKDSFSPLLQDTSAYVLPNGSYAYFYEETQPRDIDGGIIELDEFYAEIPQDYTEIGLEAYTYQFVNPYGTSTTGYGGVPSLVELTIPAKSKVVHTFGLVDYDGTTSLAIHKAYKMMKDPLAGAIFRIGDPNYHSPGRTTDILAKDSVLTRWHGPIWRRTEVFVDKLTPESLT